MNKNLIFFVLGLIAVLVLANFYFINRAVEPVVSTPQAKIETETQTAQKNTPTVKASATAATHKAQATAGEMIRKKSPGKDARHDASWQKPTYQPTEVEQARAAILATLTPQEQKEAQEDLYKMSMFYRNVQQVDQAIENAKKNGNKAAVKKLERFRMLAYPND